MEIRFYHLQTQNIEEALPALLAKAATTGRRIVVHSPKSETLKILDDLLWTCTPDSFLAHGMCDQENERHQPILLSNTGKNANEADMLVLCDAETIPQNMDDFSLCCDFLNGQDDVSVASGRQRWKSYKDAGYDVTYWQQTESGGWEQKA